MLQTILAKFLLENVSCDAANTDKYECSKKTCETKTCINLKLHDSVFSSLLLQGPELFTAMATGVKCQMCFAKESVLN